MDNKLLHTPEGVRDIYGDEFIERASLKHSLLSMLREQGYKDIETPTFEYFEVFSSNIGTTPSKELYKFYDKEGNTLVLRSDFTPSIARAFSKFYSEYDEKVKLCYSGSTFVNTSDLQGKLKESTQIGAELYNEDSADADYEMISLMINSMKLAGLNDFVITIGNVEFFKGLCDEYGIGSDDISSLREMITNKNFFGVKGIVEPLDIPDVIKDLLLKISYIAGSISQIKKTADIVTNDRSKAALKRLIDIYEKLKANNLEKYVTFDLGMLSKYHYYTGVIFRAYTHGSGDAVMKGGRYDNLVGEFGKASPAIGFCIVLDDLYEAVKHNEVADDNSKDNYITFALGKGRLAKSALELLEKIGITCEEMKDKDTRKLIFINEELKLKFFLSKGPDVPTYVEYGAADIGVVGKDTILEENRKNFEVLDLGFGKCRMCVCGPKSALEKLKHHEMIKVATKYPVIAKEYFHNIKHQTVDIIKLNGSIELAPIVGLSDVIVDIVETGSTLKENGLEVLEEVCPLSARVIVNPVSMRVKAERINKIIEQLQELV